MGLRYREGERGKGSFFCLHENTRVPSMKRAGRGSIINLLLRSYGLVGAPDLPALTTPSKGAVAFMTKTDAMASTPVTGSG